MGACTGHGRSIFEHFVSLSTHQLVEALPKGSDGFVFTSHAYHFFELPIEYVAG
jgi:hypothetical protein